jgi:hypothetical protein
VRVERAVAGRGEAPCGPRRLRRALASGSRNVPSPPSLLAVLAAVAVIACLAWALTASASVPIFPPSGPYQPPAPIVVCHESKVVPSTPTHGIGSTITCQSYGVVAG